MTLRLIDKNNNTVPITIDLKHTNLKNFQPGEFLQLYCDNGTWFFDKSDGRCPLGIIDDIKNGIDDTTAVSNIITVWPIGLNSKTPLKMFQTDQLADDAKNFKVSESVFVRDGKLSSKPLYFDGKRSDPVGEVLGIRDESILIKLK